MDVSLPTAFRAIYDIHFKLDKTWVFRESLNEQFKIFCW
jgi:hypothetical protein